MKYIDSVKEQILSYMIMILIFLSAREVARYFASNYTSAVITWDHIITFTVMSLWHIFLTPLYIERFKESAFSNPLMGFEFMEKDQDKK